MIRIPALSSARHSLSAVALLGLAAITLAAAPVLAQRAPAAKP
eukprot:gene22253-28335_t